MDSASKMVDRDYECLRKILASKNGRYARQWVVVAGGRVAWHGTDNDEMVRKARVVQDKGGAPLVHYIYGEEPKAFML